MTFRSYGSATGTITYYLSATSATGFGTDYRAYATSTGTADTTTTIKNAKNTGRFFFDPFTSQSTATGTPSATALKGYGWRSSGLYDKIIPAGTWTFKVTITATATGTGHMEFWVYKCNSDGTGVENLFSIDATGTNVLATTTTTTYSYQYSGSQYDLTGKVLVVEYWLHVTAATASSTAQTKLKTVSADSSVTIPIYTQHTMEVEFTGTSNTKSWSQLVWTVDSAWTIDGVTVTLQLYNYQTEQYPTSGDGCISYTSSGTPNTDQIQSQTITSNPTYFRDVSGNWKIKIKGVKSTTTRFDFKADLVEYNVTHVNQAPVASFTYSPVDPLVNETVTFNALASYDPDGYISRYGWDFGDGNLTTVTNPIITHVYTTAASTVNYTVTLTVTDNEGSTCSTTQIVPVTNPSILYVSLPAGTYFGPDPDNWLSQCWRLNITGLSATFTVRISNIHASYASYDTHLIIALNDASYAHLDSLTVDTTTIPKISFVYGKPKPYGFHKTWENDVYPTWFSDAYVVGIVNPKSYKDVQVLVAFSNTSGVRMHFDAYGSAKCPPPPVCKGRVTDNPHQKDSTVLFWPPPLIPPVACFTVSNAYPNVCETVTFDATCSYDPDGNITSYEWIFGDGNTTTVTDPIITHHYDTFGNYTVTLTVTDNDGLTNSTSKSIWVRAHPYADFTWSPPSPQACEMVTFNASASAPDGGVIISYEWDFGDGNITIIGDDEPLTPIITHHYTAPGDYNVTLTVTDSENKSDTMGKMITVIPLKYYLTVETDPPGLSPAPTPPSNWYDNCTYVNLTAPAYANVSADARYRFDYWDVNGISQGVNVTEITVHMDANYTATAHYVLEYYLTMSTNVGIVSPGSGWYDAGSTVQIKATAPGTIPGERYVWLGWNGTGTGSYSGLDNPRSITINGPINETATWRHEYQLTVTSPYDTPKPTSGWFEAGESINASVTSPCPGSAGVRYVCTGWTGTGSVPASGTATIVTFNITEPSSITWKWKTQYYLTVKTDPTGLSPAPTPPSGWYDEGANVVLTAKAVNGYTFNYWDVDGVSKGTGVNPITVPMDNPHKATAHYEPVVPPAVGGYAVPIEKPLSLAPTVGSTPWIGLALTSLAAMAVMIILIRRRNKLL